MLMMIIRTNARARRPTASGVHKDAFSLWKVGDVLTINKKKVAPEGLGLDKDAFLGPWWPSARQWKLVIGRLRDKRPLQRAHMTSAVPLVKS